MAGELQTHDDGTLITLDDGSLAVWGDDCCCECYTSLDGCIKSRTKSLAVDFNGEFRLKKDADTPKFACGQDTSWDTNVEAAGGDEGAASAGIRFKRDTGFQCIWETVDANGDADTSLSKCVCGVEPSPDQISPSQWSIVLRPSDDPNIVIDVEPGVTNVKPLLGPKSCTTIVQVRIPYSTGSSASEIEYSAEFDRTKDDGEQNYMTVYLSHETLSCITPGVHVPTQMRLWTTP